MPRNNLRLKRVILGFLVAFVCLCACSDNSTSAKNDVNTRRYKVAVMVTASEMKRFKRTADWALENIKESQKYSDQKIQLQLEFKNQDDSDIDAYMERVANDAAYAAVVGPTRSDKVYRMASLLRDGAKPILSPVASNVELQRSFANMSNLWSLAENDFLMIESAFSHIASSRMISDLAKITLLAPSNRMNAGLVNSYADWFGFMAAEFGIKVDKIRIYDNEDELRKHVRDFMEHRDAYNVLLFDPYNDKMALALDDELSQMDSSLLGYPHILCSSNFVSDSIAKNLHYDFYRGFDLYARPESGFAQAYREHFDEEMLHGESHFFDALYILAYAAAYSAATGNDLNESVKSVVNGEDGVGGDWMVAGMRKNFEMIESGVVPNLAGVSSFWTFRDGSNSVSGSVYRGWNISQNKYVTNDFSSSEDSKHSQNPQEDWWNRYVVEVDTSFFEGADSNISYENVTERWALLVAASSGWANYRFEADVFAMYQWLKKLGYDDDHIVMIAEDDLAENKRNLYPGTLRIRLDGDNVYTAGVVDYKLSKLTAVDLVSIMNGKSSKRLPKVINAKPTDNVFIFWSGHGEPGFFEFGEGKVSYEQIISRLGGVPHRKMMIVVEACYSGGFGEMGEGIPGVVYLTAASPYETSHAAERDENMNVFLTNSFTRGLTEILEKNPDISLRNIYVELASKISGSHVQLYNVGNYGNIYKESMSEFFVIK